MLFIIIRVMETSANLNCKKYVYDNTGIAKSILALISSYLEQSVVSFLTSRKRWD